jgi:ABC-type bacteriocin/lantibiotic exporter with double-glycine peptidase domain
MSEILLLDAAMSALGAKLEDKIINAMNSLYSKITLIVAAHGLSTTRGVDLSYYFNSG